MEQNSISFLENYICAAFRFYRYLDAQYKDTVDAILKYIVYMRYHKKIDLYNGLSGKSDYSTFLSPSLTMFLLLLLHYFIFIIIKICIQVRNIWDSFFVSLPGTYTYMYALSMYEGNIKFDFKRKLPSILQ